ncbi:MAG TPA: DUF2339 domain-containing protein [Candidatus Acidoferrum sp.]|nr:DUF2339 domain-containing protein [Candidatus Acidoferrum sp.]
MDKSPEALARELELLRSQLASVAGRVYELELQAGRISKPGTPVKPPAEAPKVPATSAVTGEVAQHIPPRSAEAADSGQPAQRFPPLEPRQTLPPVDTRSVDTRSSAPPPFPPGGTAGGPPKFSLQQINRLGPKPETDLEQKIGQYWLNRIGIVAVLTGISYFLKYAFDNNWIGPSGRIGIGLLAGIALILWSERFRAKGHSAFSYSLKALGLGALYLSLWAAFQMYQLIPAEVAFAAMAAVTASAIVLAWTQDAMVLAVFALAGGFATPLLLSTGQNHEAELFAYVALLDIAVLVLVMLKPWLNLAWGSLIGTEVLVAAWASAYYREAYRAETVVFVTLFAAIFALGPLLGKKDEEDGGRQLSVASVLAVLNAGAYFGSLWAMYEVQRDALTWYALAIAACYLALAEGFRRLHPEETTGTIRLVHITLAVTFITIAVPLKLDGHWIAVGWMVESAALLWIASRTGVRLLGRLGIIALVLGILRLLLFSWEPTQRLVFNERFMTYALAVAVLGAIIKYAEPIASENMRPFLSFAKIAFSALALTALTLEAGDFFERRMAHPYGVGINSEAFSYLQWRVLRDFTYSTIWLLYGAGLMAVGFWKRSAFVRWQALVLIAFTVVKVFLYDVSALDKGYRIVSFVALGGVLLAVSFVYQRDWLKLSGEKN